MASRYTAKMLSTMRSTTASTMPNMIALGRWSAGRPAAASAISTALSPDRTRLTPRIFSRAAQSQLANSVSIVRGVSLLLARPGARPDPTRAPDR